MSSRFGELDQVTHIVLNRVRWGRDEERIPWGVGAAANPFCMPHKRPEDACTSGSSAISAAGASVMWDSSRRDDDVTRSIMIDRTRVAATVETVDLLVPMPGNAPRSPPGSPPTRSIFDEATDCGRSSRTP
jgi:hypothetical protein